jgi:hypothetical protein
LREVHALRGLISDDKRRNVLSNDNFRNTKNIKQSKSHLTAGSPGFGDKLSGLCSMVGCDCTYKAADFLQM